MKINPREILFAVGHEASFCAMGAMEESTCHSYSHYGSNAFSKSEGRFQSATSGQFMSYVQGGTTRSCQRYEFIDDDDFGDYYDDYDDYYEEDEE
jgi:hypothetical protein